MNRINFRIFLYGINFTLVLRIGIRKIFLYSVYSLIYYICITRALDDRQKNDLDPDPDPNL